MTRNIKIWKHLKTIYTFQLKLIGQELFLRKFFLKDWGISIKTMFKPSLYGGSIERQLAGEEPAIFFILLISSERLIYKKK